jgi:CheY-like chemotaxis protein
MTAVGGTKWRLLVMEDDDVLANQILEAIPGFVNDPDTAEGVRCRSFKEAIQKLLNERYDILILDLKDDSMKGVALDDPSAGLEVFESVKKTRFTPVVFYTAHPHKVRAIQNSFVRVVEKTEGLGKLKEEVGKVLGTQLPTLSRRVEEMQRDYMWDFVNKYWKEFDSPHEQADLAYLLARRLALTLQQEARRFARKLAGREVQLADPNNIHPMEMYVRPPVSKNPLAGDILKGVVGDESGFWLVLTPSCDFEQKGRLKNILLAGCTLLTGEPEYANWKKDPDKYIGPLKEIIGDNRKGTQPERFKFLPGTYFLPDLVVDFQRLKALPQGEFSKLDMIASLDSPFAEAVLARFSRYYGRLGTRDIDIQVLLSRLQAS